MRHHDMMTSEVIIVRNLMLSVCLFFF